MKKYLMRGSINPLSLPEIGDLVAYNRIGNNSGNVLYAFSVYRTLLREDTEIEVDQYRAENGTYSEGEIDQINSTYDAYILPLADAFREDFAGKLNQYSRFFQKLKIPVYLIGVGIRAPYDVAPGTKFPFDDAVKRFVSAVLEKSSIVGLRGEITGDYLKSLGFVPEKDYTVIGCPSLYTFGRDLHQRELHLTDDSKISVNYGLFYPRPVVRWLNNLSGTYKNFQFVGQSLNDFMILYEGIPTLPKADPDRSEGELRQILTDPENYPRSLDHPFLKNDQFRMFLDARSWFENMHSVDLSIGGRFHGNVGAILGGAPVYVMSQDARMQELTRYHGIPNEFAGTFDTSRTLEELIGGRDLRIPPETQHRNFDHFVDFLKQNGLPSIYDEDPNRTDAPLDSFPTKNYGELKPISHCDREEITGRIQEHIPYMTQRYSQLQDKMSSDKKALNEKIGRLTEEKKKISEEKTKLTDEKTALEKDLKELKEKYAKLQTKEQETSRDLKKAEKQLSRKSVKFILRLANIARKCLFLKPIE